MLAIGQKIYFRKEADGRLLKGTILGMDGGMIQVQGTRTATKHTPPVFTLTADRIVTDHISSKNRVRNIEQRGNGMSIVAAESVRRMEISEARLGMTETQVLQARAMLEIRRRAVRKLAASNRITTNSADHDELNSEYIVAQLTALRATAASATDDDIREFKRFLAGATDDSRVLMTICRTSRTAAIRYLKQRQHWQYMHDDISGYENRLAA